MMQTRSAVKRASVITEPGAGGAVRQHLSGVDNQVERLFIMHFYATVRWARPERLSLVTTSVHLLEPLKSVVNHPD